MLPIAVISLALHAYIGARLLPALAAWPAAQAGLFGLLVVSALAMPFALGRLRQRSPRLGLALMWLGLLSMGFFSSLLV